MAIAIDPAPFDQMIDNFAQTVSRNAWTEAYDNSTGAEILDWSTTSTSLTAAFFKKDQLWKMDKEGLFENSDAIILLKRTESANIVKNDKITYDGQEYLVDKVVKRQPAGTLCYIAVGLHIHDY